MPQQLAAVRIKALTQSTEHERMALPLAQADPEVYEQIRAETERQNSRLELIASENFTSEAVLEAAGSIFTIDNDKIELPFGDQRGQAFDHDGASGAADDIANEKNTHKWNLFIYLCMIFFGLSKSCNSKIDGLTLR